MYFCSHPRRHVLALAVSGVFGTLTSAQAASPPTQTAATPDASASAPAAPDGGVALPAVEVRGTGETATSPVAGYVAKRSATGTRSDTPIIETPQSVSVVTADQMRDQKAQNINQAFHYTAGVMSDMSAGGPGYSDSLYIRGFAVDSQDGGFFRDGMRYMSNLYAGQQEPYGMERLEVLKGAASVLYGAMAPGGMVNAVSKRPVTDTLREFNVEYGSYGRKQFSTDLGGRLDPEGVWSYRLTALIRNSGNGFDFGEDDRTYIAPALTWHPSAATTLTLLANYQISKSATGSPDLPVTGSLLPNVNGPIRPNTFLGEPSWNSYANTSKSIAYIFEHKFSDALTFHQSARWYNASTDYKYTALLGDVDPETERLVARSARWMRSGYSMFTTDTNLEFTFSTGPLDHRVVVGNDYTLVHWPSDRDRSNPDTGDMAPIDVFAPVYGVSPLNLSPWNRLHEGEKRTGIYLQDQMKLANRWVLVLGGRQEWMSVTETDDLDSTDHQDNGDHAFTAHAGLVYLADNGLAPYLSFSQSFDPNSGLSRTGQRFSPSRGTQYEFGVRYQPKGSDTMLSAALYQLSKTNALTPDPVDPDYQVAQGEVRSRGLELEAKTSFTRNFSVVAAYTYTNAVITKSNLPGGSGSSWYAPRNMISLWADYSLGLWGLAGLHVGGGVRYVSARPDVMVDSELGVPAYTLFDARISYATGPWEFALNANNLTNRHYIPNQCSSGVAGGCDYGTPLSVIATASYRM